LQKLFAGAVLAYLEVVEMAPTQPVTDAAVQGVSGLPGALDGVLREQLWLECDAAAWGLGPDEFNAILLSVGRSQNYGLAEGTAASRQQQAAFFSGLRLADLVLARACAAGNERAWERFVALYRQPLTRAAMAIAGSETLGRDLAGQLYAELFGLATRDGARRCPLLSYRGRGSLMGWLRTTLAQRHVDHLRRTRREEPLEKSDAELDLPAPDPEPATPPAELSRLEKAVEDALRRQDAEERFLLAAYYLDQRTLMEIARVLHVHEATVSRKLRRALDGIRKQVLKNLQSSGLSRRAAQEALGSDPRDLHPNLKKLLQSSLPGAFQEKAAP
jgi:RNA polymerase sigma-70 factor (ECF subfamily)